MQRLGVAIFMLALLFMFTGCYHATVTTGEEPSAQTVEEPWANSFIAGLVPPSTVETAQQCPNGVARVETRLPFLHQIVGGLTFGIYTPMEITATCAAGGSANLSPPDMEIDEVTVPAGATEIQIAESIGEAAQESARTGEAVTVRLDE